MTTKNLLADHMYDSDDMLYDDDESDDMLCGMRGMRGMCGDEFCEIRNTSAHSRNGIDVPDDDEDDDTATMDEYDLTKCRRSDDSSDEEDDANAFGTETLLANPTIVKKRLHRSSSFRSDDSCTED